MSKVIKFSGKDESKTSTRLITPKRIGVLLQDAPPSVSDEQEAKETEETLLQAKEEAEQIIKHAKQRASEISKQIDEERQAWEIEKKQLVDEAWQEGHEMGLHEGKEKGYAQYEQFITEAKEVVDESKGAFQNYIEQAEFTILELAIASAEAILDTTLQEEPEQYVHLVKKALKQVRGEKEVEIHVNPCNYSFILSAKDELEATFPREVDLFIYPDESLAKNACYIESEHVKVDASIDHQLVELKERLVELLSTKKSQ